MALEACTICGAEKPGLAWTDLHGEAECTRCGAPYQVIQYDDEGHRVDAPPRLSIKPDAVEGVKEYWEQFHTRMWLGRYLAYRSLVHQEQSRAFVAWWSDYCEKHPELNL